MTGILIRERKGRFERQGRRPCEEGGRDSSCATTSKKGQKPPYLEEASKDSLLEPSEGMWPGRDLDFQNSEIINLCCFKPPCLCTLLQQP